MSAYLHPDELIARLRLDDRRCFVITARPCEGKTRMAKLMEARYGGRRLDVLDMFAANPDLASGVDVFTAQRCKAFLQNQVDGKLVLVDEMEFLWHRWDQLEKQQFLNILKLWRKPAFFGVFLTPDPVIEHFAMPDQDGRPRILGLHDLQSIG